MTQNPFTDRVAFVTGAGGGIGQATAVAFAQQGASVAVADLSADKVRDTVRMIEDDGGKALALRCDVTSDEDIAAALQRTVDTFGHLDYAFNNAGIEQPITPAADITDDDWSRILDVNTKGVFLCMKREIPLMLANGGGAIVNTSSGAGIIGIAGQAAYAASKHAVIGLTKSAALDYASTGVRINAICPGIIQTPMMDRFTGGTTEGRQRVIDQEPIGRMGRPEEIAAAVLWLCSDLAAFTIGHALVVDGGQTAA